MSNQAYFSRFGAVRAGLLLFVLSGVSIATVAAAVDVEVIHNFSPEPLRAGGGERPRAGVVRDSEGNLYGTTESGGKYGKGTLYVTSDEGHTRILHSFRGADGAYPRAELVIRDNAVLYGTTRGSETGAKKLKESVVFRFDRKGGFKVMHTFDWETEGGQPSALLASPDGYQYGTLAKSHRDGYGALFRISPEGGVEILHRFSESGIDTPTGTLVQGGDGALFGTSLTYYPRDEPGVVRAGAIYRYSGRVLKVIHEYPVIGDGSPSTEGSDPDSGLVIGFGGALYGLTWSGGAHYGGTFFKLRPDGTGYVELFSMPQNFQSGTNALILGRDGNFYGSTRRGENFAPGQLIRLTPEGGYYVLYEFPTEVGLPKGNSPMGRLVQDPDGRLYGTALAGGIADRGTLFRTVEPVGQREQ